MSVRSPAADPMCASRAAACSADPPPAAAPHPQPGGGVLLTPAQLARYDGKRGRRLYLAIMGEVYDVTAGARFYGAAPARRARQLPALAGSAPLHAGARSPAGCPGLAALAAAPPAAADAAMLRLPLGTNSGHSATLSSAPHRPPLSPGPGGSYGGFGGRDASRSYVTGK